MRVPPAHELPDELQPVLRKAIRIEWFSIAYLATAIVFLYLTLGTSQAMKAAWIEDILSLLPPAAFLVAARIRHKQPSERMPFGYHRAVSIAYLIASTAILVLGAYLVLDSVSKLIRSEHPSIGLIELGDGQLWQGWLMLAALAYTGIPSVVLGLRKRPLARALHDKVLHADAEMNRADWMTAFAAMGGIVGIGLGLWWADALAGLVIGLDITRDGWKYVGHAARDLIDARPRTYDESGPHPCKQLIIDELRKTDWVRSAIVRMRENGHVLAAEVWVVPLEGGDTAARVEELVARLHAIDWMMHTVAVMPVETIEGAPDDEPIVGGAGRALGQV